MVGNLPQMTTQEHKEIWEYLVSMALDWAVDRSNGFYCRVYRLYADEITEQLRNYGIYMTPEDFKNESDDEPGDYQKGVLLFYFSIVLGWKERYPKKDVNK